MKKSILTAASAVLISILVCFGAAADDIKEPEESSSYVEADEDTGGTADSSEIRPAVIAVLVSAAAIVAAGIIAGSKKEN